MLLGTGTGWIDAVILASIVIPIGGFIVFAIWFLRAGKRQDERERAAQHRPPR